MLLVVWTVLVSLGYAGLYVLAPTIAPAAVVLFVALLLVPECYATWRRKRRGRGGLRA